MKKLNHRYFSNVHKKSVPTKGDFQGQMSPTLVAHETHLHNEPKTTYTQN